MHPHHQPNPPIVYTFPSKPLLSKALAAFILKAQKESIDKKGRFTVALSGGSLPNMLTELVGKEGVKWGFWHIFYADERAVPLDHPDSNHYACTQVLLSKVPIPQENIHALDPSLLPKSTSDKTVNQDDVDTESLAEAYEHVLIQHFVQKDAARFPIFDLILLGMGPDGHTASLFPGHSLLSGSASSISPTGGATEALVVDVDMRWVAPIADSPKPPPKRVTLTLSVLNHASRVAFVACGKEKVPVVKKVLDGEEGKKEEELLPAARVKPVYPGNLYWFLDEDAAGDVRYPREAFKL